MTTRRAPGLVLISIVVLSAARGLGAQELAPGVSYEGQPAAEVILIARPTVNVVAYQPLVVQHWGFPLNGAGLQGEALLCTAANEPSSCTAQVTVPRGGHQLFIFNSRGAFRYL